MGYVLIDPYSVIDKMNENADGVYAVAMEDCKVPKGIYEVIDMNMSMSLDLYNEDAVIFVVKC